MSVLHRQLLRCARMMVRFNKRVLSQLHALLKNLKAGRLALPSFAPSDSVPDGFLRAFWLALWLWVYRIHWVDCFIDRRNLCYLCSRLCLCCLCLCCWICYCCIYWFYRIDLINRISRIKRINYGIYYCFWLWVSITSIRIWLSITRLQWVLLPFASVGFPAVLGKLPLPLHLLVLP